MASQETGGIALLAIQPKYSRAILDGSKRVEFRRKAFSQRPQFVVVYETHPTQMVVGFFRVAHVTQARPMELWKMFQEVGAITRQAFRAYFRGRENAVAIGIAGVFRLTTPLTLCELSSGLVAPQSYRYLEPAVFAKVCNRGATRVRTH